MKIIKIRYCNKIEDDFLVNYLITYIYYNSYYLSNLVRLKWKANLAVV